MVQVYVQPTSYKQLEQNKSYIISGGLGGVGQMVARWMARRGARNLILRSRSGPAGHDVGTFLAELRRDGVKVFAPSCDIRDIVALRGVIKECSTKFPPIRGCVQASMALEVRL